MNRAQRGFTLLETLAALGIATVAALFLLNGVTHALRWRAALSERAQGESTLDALADRLESEEDSAWAIFTPAAEGSELHFFARDARNRAKFWAYRYDSKAQTLQRILYGVPDGAAVNDGPPMAGITGFFAQTYPVTALADPSTPLYSGLYRDAALIPASVGFGYTDRPWIAGGNQVTYVRVATAHAVRVLQLSTQTAPSGFTVVLRYTPSPGPSPSSRVTAAVATSVVLGRWFDCPDRSRDCSNADWPQYRWTQTITSRYYESSDGGFSWTLFNTAKTSDSGISGPTGGDLPSAQCTIDPPADYAQACSPDWVPAAPPGLSGIEVTP